MDEFDDAVAGVLLDAQVAEKVMGWKRVDEPSLEWWSEAGWKAYQEKVFFVHHNRVTVADPSGYARFEPSSSYDDAFAVINKLNEEGWHVKFECMPLSEPSRGGDGKVIDTANARCLCFVAYGKIVTPADGCSEKLRIHLWSLAATMPLAVCKTALRLRIAEANNG